MPLLLSCLDHFINICEVIFLFILIVCSRPGLIIRFVQFQPPLCSLLGRFPCKDIRFFFVVCIRFLFCFFTLDGDRIFALAVIVKCLKCSREHHGIDFVEDVLGFLRVRAPATISGVVSKCQHTNLGQQEAVQVQALRCEHNGRYG